MGVTRVHSPRLYPRWLWLANDKAMLEAVVEAAKVRKTPSWPRSWANFIPS